MPGPPRHLRPGLGLDHLCGAVLVPGPPGTCAPALALPLLWRGACAWFSRRLRPGLCLDRLCGTSTRLGLPNMSHVLALVMARGRFFGSLPAGASFVLHTRFLSLCLRAQASQIGLNFVFLSQSWAHPHREKVQDGAGPTHHPPLHRAAGEGTKLTMLRMRTARLLAFASLRLSDAFAAVSPDKKGPCEDS